MRHFRQWQRKALGLYRLSQTGSLEQPRRITGFTAGNCKKGAHSTSTIAYTLTIPLCAKKYSHFGNQSGKIFSTKWDTVGTWTSGGVLTELTTRKGIAYCKLTRREYTHQSQPTCPVILLGVKISILLTRIPHTILVVGGGHPEKQPIY